MSPLCLCCDANYTRNYQDLHTMKETYILYEIFDMQYLTFGSVCATEESSLRRLL